MKKIFISLIIFVCIIWIISFIRFAVYAGKTAFDKNTETDMILVLTRGTNRINVALDLLEEKKSKILFISGVYKGTTLKAITSEKFPDTIIILGKSARNTLENAQETAMYVKRNNITSIRLVTSSYHMKRSILEMKTFLPNINIIPNPVFSDNVKYKDWWKRSGTFVLLIIEHAKYNFALLRHFIYDIFNINYSKITSIEDSYL